MLGGLDESSSVILWSLLAPLGAVAFDRPDRAWPWFAAFVATVVIALVLSEVVRPDGADLPEGFVRTFDVLNIVVVSLVAMMLLVTFARGRDTAQAVSRRSCSTSSRPRSRERLQSDPELDRRPLRRGEHPVRRRRRLHAALEPPRRAGGRRPPRSAVHHLRRAGRPLRGREDQDDRRLLHGRRRRSAPARRITRRRSPVSRSRCGIARTRACRSPTRTTSGSASGSAPGLSSRA